MKQSFTVSPVRTFRLSLSALAMLAASMPVAQAQVPAGWPAKPIRLINPFAPGGAVDVTARSLGTALGEALGTQVVIENRGGAGGMLGVDAAAKAAPDGYTLVVGTVGPMAISPALTRKMPYDPVRDLAPISRAADTINLLVVHPSLPVQSVKELVALAKARPNELLYASAGVGANDHLAGELFNALAGTKITHVPYKGGAPAMLDLIGGQVQVYFASYATARPQMDAKKVRALGLTRRQRFELLPDLPTIDEAGVKGFEVANWYGIFAPAGIPKDILTRLNREIVRALAQPDVKSRMLQGGVVAVSSTPEELGQFHRMEMEKWAKVIRDAKVTPE
ncbi:MAG: Bug family tripartite tricarboxylate transporter substrate binding protein [Burkholderiales bacterium]